MSDQTTGRTALLAGATGLIGSHVLTLLLADPAYAKVVALVRRPLEGEHQKLTGRIVDFDALADLDDLPRVDDAFCCLGTTMKKAGSKAAFRRVDHDYVVATARLALTGGARRFLLVSAIGSSTSAPNFYSRVKGEAEDSVAALGFSAFHVFQPSILIGDRRENRPGERLGVAAARVLNGALIGPLRRYRGIRADAVAAAMAQAAKSDAEGRLTHAYDDIEHLSMG